MKQVGDKYYRVIEDKVDIVRIHKVTDSFITISRGINKSKVQEDYLNDFIKLNPDGTLFFNVVQMGRTEEEGHDVVVVLNRKKDLGNNIGVPYLSCRQNVFDIFSNQTNRTDKTYLGMCMTVDNTPEGTPYSNMLACYGIIYSEKISTYMDDTLDNILDMINKQYMYNNVLMKIYKALSNSKYEGLSRDLKSLLKDNHFMYDFRKGFDIHSIDMNLTPENNTLNSLQIGFLEDYLKNIMHNVFIVEYSKEINLNKIEKEHILVCDNTNKIYIITYDKGSYINRPFRDNILDKRDAITMIKHIRSK